MGLILSLSKEKSFSTKNTNITKEEGRKGKNKKQETRNEWDQEDEASGALVHDDDLITGAMCSLLDRLEWTIRNQPMIAQVRDLLE